MKITRDYLKQIIKEELSKASEQYEAPLASRSVRDLYSMAEGLPPEYEELWQNIKSFYKQVKNTPIQATQPDDPSAKFRSYGGELLSAKVNIYLTDDPNVCAFMWETSKSEAKFLFSAKTEAVKALLGKR
jgi:hypothetical protein